jgi:hypothetical protein
VGISLCGNAWTVFVAWRDSRNIRALESLLMELCIKAYCRQHQPVWRAWANVMGTINVKVEGESIRREE